MTGISSISDRLTRSVAQRGVWGTLCLCAVETGWRILPNFRRFEERRREADETFDQTYGVDTGGVFRPKRHEVVGENWALGGNYQAINPADLEKALLAADLPYDEFTFVDMGSGKGRTVLLASRFPFRKVVGVEYCPKLNEVARQNVERFPAREKRCEGIEIVDADAAEYPIPGGPLLLLLNNPFAEPVMARVIQNVAASYRQNPRRIVIVYFWPNLAHLWEQTGVFKRIQETPAIFETMQAPTTH